MSAAALTSNRPQNSPLSKVAHYAERTAQIAVAGATVLFLTSALVYLAFGHWSVTHQDFWRLYDILLNQPWPQSSLTKFNNHSLFFPSLIFLADLYLLHGNQQFVFLAGLILLFLTLGLLLVPFWRNKALSLSGKLAVTLLLTVSTFWMGRADIIASGGFTCNAALSMAGALLAFLFLPAMAGRGSQRSKATTIVLAGAFISSFSASMGLMTWPVLLFLGWCIRLSWRSLILITCGGVVAAIIFIFLPSPLPLVIPATDGLSFSLSVRLKGLCRLLGSPVVSAARAWSGTESSYTPLETSLFSLSLGAAGLALAAVTGTIRFIRRDLEKGGMEFMGWALIASNVLVMLIIVVGRAALIETVPSEVAAPRYFFWSTLFWTGLFMAVIRRAEFRRWLACPVLLGTLILTIFAIPKHCHEGEHYRYAAILAESGALSLINNVHAPEEVKILFRDPAVVYHLAAQLRTKRLDMFSTGSQDWLGANEKTLFQKHDPEQLAGACRVTALFHGGDSTVSAQLGGSVQATGNSRPALFVVLDSNGVVRGIGRSLEIPATINKILYEGKFPGASFTCFVRDYDPVMPYIIRGVSYGRISDGQLPVSNGS